MPEANKAPAPWDNPGTLPTDAAQQAAAEEQARQAAALAASTQGATTPAIGAASPDSSAASGTAVALAGAVPEVASDVTVTVTVKKPFTLRLSTTDGTTITHHEFPYKAGVQEMLLSHAEHWWAKANGVEVYKKS